MTINSNYDATTLSTYFGLKEIMQKNPDELVDLIYCKTNIGGIFFDGFFDIEHRSDLKITSHPVQMGASISDHAYLEPLEVTMTVRMSDCNEDIIEGQFGKREKEGFATNRNLTAFEVLQALQRSRVPIMVNTKLRRYDNMLIKSIAASDDNERLFGMEATVTMQEVIVAQAETVKTVVSKRNQTTGSTDGGTEVANDPDKGALEYIVEGIQNLWNS